MKDNLSVESNQNQKDDTSGLLYEILTRSAKEYPDNSAIIFYGKKISYRDLELMADAFCQSLVKLGIKKGDRIALFLPNCPQFVVALYGISKAGAIASPINPLYMPREIDLLLSDLKPKAFVTLTMFCDKVFVAEESKLVDIFIISHIADFLPAHISPIARLKERFAKKIFHSSSKLFKDKIYSFKKLITKDNDNAEQITVALSDTAILMYTSGTTGKPKGVPLTHANLIANLFQIDEAVKTSVRTGEEVQLGVLPFFHIYGLNFVLNYSISKAFTIVLMPKFESKATCEAIGKYKITIVAGVPALFTALIKRYEKNPKKYDFSSIRFCGSGASPCPISTLEKIREITKRPIIEAYGLTETSPITHMNPPDGIQKLGSVGIPAVKTECKLIDPDTLEVCGSGKIGLLYIRGPQVFHGYFNNEEATNKVLDSDSWFCTKDVAMKDDDNYFYIRGRIDDMINIGGEKVWPQEIEDVLKEHPAIGDAAVIGVFDDRFGEKIKAFIVKDSAVSESDILDFSRHHLVKYKVPKEIEFIESVPRSPLGKTLYYLLKK